MSREDGGPRRGTFPALLLSSLRQHGASSLLALAAVAAGTALLVAVGVLRDQAHRQFNALGSGVDAVLAPKGSPLQVALNAVFHIDEMPGRIPWRLVEEARGHPAVADAVAFVTGHSYGGFRVNAVEDRFLDGFAYRPGERFSVDPARGGAGRLTFASRQEAVAGATAAARLGLRIGQTFHPVCGVTADAPVHADQSIAIVGILAPTGTPHDRAIYIPLASVYGMDGHGPGVAAMADDPAVREVSGAYLRLQRIRGGAFHPAVQDLVYELAQSSRAQCVLPAEVMPRLHGIIGWADAVLRAVGGLVGVLAAALLATAMAATMRERRRDLVLLRALGAPRRTLSALVIAQAAAIALAGAALGWLAGRGIAAAGCALIEAETGMHLDAYAMTAADALIAPAAVAIGVLAGAWPAWRAYRLGVHAALAAT